MTVNKLIHVLFVGLVFMTFTPTYLVAQKSFHRLILDQENELCYTYTQNPGADNICVTRINGETDTLFFVYSIDSMKFDYNFAKVGVFNNFIFSITYSNLKISSFNKDLYSEEDKKLMFKNFYLFNCVDKNQDNKLNGSVDWKYTFDLENLEKIACYPNPIFNYDFLINEGNIRLIVLLDNMLYLYEIDDTMSLPKAKWVLINKSKVNIENENFAISNYDNDSFVLHTLTQGEFKVDHLLDAIKVEKLSNINLNNKIFLEDKRTKTTYMLTENEYSSLLKSKDHIAKLNEILTNKK